jgi:thiol-disulfide isomerase/thioredoxin
MYSFRCLVFACLSVVYVSKGQGVSFVTNGNLRNVFDLAKAQNKVVLIEVYSPECHVCQAFAPTFEQKAVGDFYNSRFVSYKLAIESDEAKAFLTKQNIWISSLPTLLFFDKNVGLQHIAVMSENRNNAKILTDAAATALNTGSRTGAYKSRFLAGERASSFLIEYGLMSRIQRDTTASIAAGEAYFKSLKATEYVNKERLLVLEKMIIDADNGLFKYFMANLPKYYALRDRREVNTIAENILMWSLYSSRGANYTSQKVKDIKVQLAKVGVDAKSIAARAWMLEAAALFREKQNKSALNVIEARLKGLQVSEGEAKYLCTFIRSKTADKATLAYSKKWCK